MSSKLALSASTTLGFTQSFSSPKHFTHIKAVNPRSTPVSKACCSHPLYAKRVKGFFSAGSPTNRLNADLIHGPGGATRWCAPIAMLPDITLCGTASSQPSAHTMARTGGKTHSPATSSTASPVLMPGKNYLAHPISLHQEK